MNPRDQTFLFRELQVIQKIIQDETWLEGERRGCYVSPDDGVVREKVCAIVLRIGAELRESVMHAMPAAGTGIEIKSQVAEPTMVHDAAA